MTILFLDIDSVMVLWEDGDPVDKRKTHLGNFFFNEENVSALNNIIEQTNCDIVLSSDWRNRFTLDELKEIFTICGCVKSPMSITGTTRNKRDIDSERAEEIIKWVDDNNPKKWVVVDDLFLDKTEFKNRLDSHFVFTPNGLFLTENDVIEKFNV